MDRNDQQAIEELFGKLREVERRAPPRDREAEALIGEHIARQPAAPYHMAQAIIALEHALAAAQQRLEEAEQQRGSGGFMAEIFGTGRTRAERGRERGRQERPRQRALPGEDGGRSGGAGPWGGRPSFLGGAMQTALGVAGGVVLGSFLADMLTPDAAAAAPVDQAAPEEERFAGEEAAADEDFAGDDAGGADFGGDFGGDF